MQDKGKPMTGPEHYKEAARLLAEAEAAERSVGEYDIDTDGVARDIARAQVHATLAQAAASALMHGDADTMPADWQEWNRAAGASAADESSEEPTS